MAAAALATAERGWSRQQNALVADALALVAAIETQVRVMEEHCLLRAHGDAYSEYASRSGRFVPGLGGLT
ncbi:hypothetical protein AB0E59_36215 [Lentzea sp. NPDC034063]|uniref:hypothetical protein n=1 Tax=unclassified Lentzea TaxID=2643253 RepID=UPI0033C71850